MAKKKLTIEDVLVPKEEIPYKVPENWCWVYTPYVFDVQYGKNLPISKLTEEGYTVFGANGLIGFYSEYTYESPKVLISCRGANSGVVNVSYNKSYITNNSLIMDCKIDMDTRFVKYLFMAMDKKSLISGTAQPQITVKAFSKYPIPLPPLLEQERIINRIESLFDKVDKASELVEEAREGFEKRRAAILEKAFSGELTKTWRENHTDIKKQNLSEQSKVEGFFDIPNTWRWIKSKDIFMDLPRNGYSPKSTETPTQYKTLKLGAITKGYFDDTQIKYISEEIPMDSRLWLKNGDFLIQRSNSIDYVGTCAIYTGEDNECIYPDLIMKAELNKKIVIPNWVVYYINSYYGKNYFVSNATGTAGNMPKINQKVVTNLPIPIPPIEEQIELTRIMDKVFENENDIKELISIDNQIDIIKKSILAKAFRGKLCRNNQNEEKSFNMLKSIIEGL